MGILSQIRHCSRNGENIEDLESKYIEIMEREPVVPLLPNLFFEDVTQEALALQISDGWPSASLWSDEGALVMLYSQRLSINKKINHLPSIAHKRYKNAFH